MRRGHFQYGVVGLALIVSTLATSLFVPASAQQLDNEVTPLSIQRFKVVSGDQFIEIKNNTDQDILMTDVQLMYYNNFDLAAATSSKIISLSGTIPARGYYLVTDGVQRLCYQSAVASASLSFATGSGQVQLVRWEQTPGKPFGFTTLDAVSWFRKSSASAPNPPSGVVLFQNASQNPTEFGIRNWKDHQGGELPIVPGGGSWQVAKTVDSDCRYEVVSGEQFELQPEEEFAFFTAELPPVRYVAAVSAKADGVKVNRNVGKMNPIINEILPNPASPQTDADDEFIEIYNPNDSTFDLSGFKIAFGSTNPRRYTFPEGTILEPKEFKIFTSGNTSISLSNTSAQVWLLDPNEKVIHQSDPYKGAKDGQAWALDSTANTWVWTLQPTPGEMNALTGNASGTGNATTTKAVLGLTHSNSQQSTVGTESGVGTLADKTPLHPVVLAVVGLGALAYASYEYRQDVANKLYELRRNHGHRRALRQKVSRRRSVSARE